MARGDRFERICARQLDERALRMELLDALRPAIPFDAYAWLLTDPQTCVGSAPLAEVPCLADLPALIRSKYLTPVNRWTDLRADAAVTLLEATAGARAESRVWREILAGYGIDDVASTVFRDRHGCWGFLDLWRTEGTFSVAEREHVGAFARIATPALRRGLALTFTSRARSAVAPDGPVVLLLSEDLVLLTQTPLAESYLRALLPTEADRAPVPAGAFNVAAQLLAREQGVDDHPPWARVHLGDGQWVTFRAARIRARGSSGEPAIAVTIEPTPPAERTALYARVVGLTERETELLRHLVAGHDTRALARLLCVSQHTVQDHLKAVFAKSGTNSRRALVASATGAG